MQWRHSAVRLWVGVAVIGALLAVARPAGAQADPPTLVARLARIAGVVSLRDTGQAQWRLARLNLPIPPGDAVAVEPGGQAALDIAASRIGLAGGTELRLDALTDQSVEATLISGEVYLRLLETRAPVRINTPRGIVHLSSDGRYAITAGDAQRPTEVNVVEGTARLEDTNTTFTAGQHATIAGAAPYNITTGRARISAFMVAMMAQDPRLAEATPEPVRHMTGAGDLAQFGEWRIARDLGAVWVPRVEAGWVPYRAGIWAWVAPWGWTWADDAPWGFAPFHYGRWAEVEEHVWAWVPAPLHAGVGFRPAYAPAVVRFLGLRSPGTTPGRGAITVLGWVPLGPGEAYRPGFAASAELRRRWNVNHLRQSDAAFEAGASRNLAAATIVPAWAMIAAQPAQLARTRLPPLPPESLEPLPPTGLPGPALSTLGMTPAMAKQMGLTGAERAPQLILPTPLPPLRAAGSGYARPAGAAPGPEILPPYPGLRRR